MMMMNKNWKFVRLRQEFLVGVLLLLLCQSLACWSLNEEGFALLRLRERVVNDPIGALWAWKEEDGEINHCSWFGVECCDGKVVVLNLKDLCLEGTLAPELGTLIHIKSIILRNNSFTGTIPEGISELKELEVLDLAYNNFNESLPSGLSSDLSLTIQNSDLSEGAVLRRLLQETANTSAKSPKAPPLNYSMPPSPRTPTAPTHPASSEPSTKSTYLRGAPVPRPPSAPASKPSGNDTEPNTSAPSPSGSNPSIRDSKSSHHAAILVGSIGGGTFLLILIIIAYLLKTYKVSTVKPWATGLSGQLQKAFVTVESTKDWSKNLETQFRKKIDTLSKVNHKNFVNLLGYCEEDNPFTRMLVFEYAPNGTLFEHLHIKESEHLDWAMRLRIIMGMAYCLEHMHQLNPPVPHNNLSSSAVSLTEDYAAKISDPCFWNELTASDREADGINLSDTTMASLESNVYSFGVLLFEIVTGRMPYLVDNGSSEDMASDYLRREQALVEMVDPTLNSFDKDQFDLIGEVIKSCIDPEPGHRPDMRGVSARLREITAITPDNAIPKLSPLWWAELEIMSTEAS
ncbi:putative inactive receptor-like protein kinase [Gossypium australe]|uniref:Putative inactive receptor-like protein kinase n=1 Tax=Gossypium australe TaxID=47621 RepID=A0A5B6V5A1_9ROSI|nr:putative inactive receptor-like protein kinase [Gossypium australe]